MPLFTGYLFLYGDEQSRREGLKGNTLVQTLDVLDQTSLEHDLRQIDHLLRSGLPIVPVPDYSVGSRIRILNGPLKGLVGAVIRRERNRRFVAIVDFLKQGAAVELEDWQVEPVDQD